jgi:hypothetical protein
MANVMEYFKVVIIIMLFYSFSITILTYSLPNDALVYVTGFSDLSSSFDLETIGGDVQSSLESQTDIPVIELGALVFYSSNIILDLLLNFAFAIPQMFGLLINGLSLMLNIDSYLFVVVQLFASVTMVVLYFIGLIQLMTGIRSGRIV